MCFGWPALIKVWPSIHPSIHPSLVLSEMRYLISFQYIVHPITIGYIDPDRIQHYIITVWVISF